MKIKELAEKYNDYILERRRYYHQHPELSFHEEETTKAIMEDLKALGVEVSGFNALQGCVGIIRGGKPGPTVMLRADIDALPVVEQTGLPFASVNENCMHACGHDTHIAMQLGAAKILCDLKDELHGNVKLLFQAGEESAVGAKYVVEQGTLDDVSACFGMHTWSQLDAPKMNLQGGERMASCDTFTIIIRGMTTHGSAPHLGHDAVVAACATVMSLQSIVSRLNDPVNALVISVGKITGGQRFNIIANQVELVGTVRTFNRDFRMKIENMIRETAELAAKVYGCTAELEYNYLTGPVINDSPEVLKIASNAAVSLYGEDFLVPLEKMTGSEDFSYYMEKVPCVYGFLGARNSDVEGSWFSNHHEKFTPDEASLHHGAAVAAQFAFDFLQSKAAGK